MILFDGVLRNFMHFHGFLKGFVRFSSKVLRISRGFRAVNGAGALLFVAALEVWS